MKILLVDDEVEILEILKTLVQAEFECDIISATSGNQAVGLLKESQFDLIVSDYSMADGNGAVIYNYNKEHSNVPFIFVSGGYIEDYVDVSNFFTQNPLNSYIHKPIEIDELNNCIGRIMARNAHYEDEYVRLSDFLLLKYPASDIEVYLKISEQKYVKIKNKDDASIDEIKRYREKSEEKFYCKLEDFKTFMSSILQSHLEKLKNNHNEVVRLELCGDTIEIISSSIDFLGLNNEAKLIIQNSVETCIDLARSNTFLSAKIEALFVQRGYKISHSLTLAHICYALAVKIGFTQESILTKLIQASILHDVLLDDELASIITLTHADEMNMPSSKLKQIKEHGLKMSNLLNEHSAFSSDVLILVRDHHELPNGEGFPRKLGESNLSGLSLLFNMSLHIADYLFKNSSSEENLMALSKHLKVVGFDKGHNEKAYIEFLKMIKSA